MRVECATGQPSDKLEAGGHFRFVVDGRQEACHYVRMLKLLHRHILKEILVSTGLAMGLFVFVLLMGNALRDVAELVAAGKLGVGVFLKLIALLIPYVGAYALPLGMLTGTLIALGRLSSQREITAMKAAGLSLYQIASPVFLIAFIGMVAGVLVNLHYAPQSRVAYKQLMASAVTENPVDFIEQRRFIHEFPGYVIYMGGRDGSTMQDFWIWELDSQRRVKLFLRAAEGELFYDQSTRELILTLKNGTAEQRSAANPESFEGDMPDSLFFGELPIALPLDQLFGETSQRRTRTKEMTFAQLMERRQGELAKEAETGGPMTDLRLQVQVHLQKSFAMAYSVFSLAIFGVPLAIHVGRKETHANLAIALIIAMTYYFLIIMVSWLEEKPSLRPDLLIWLPNLIFQAIGFWMMHKASRH
ncbi:MAG: YjgP/YjgQ family permease [Puniceicoccaceae bacterium]|nr:MAG: YjgP/YjgQ family permease [Puniceicoccaceae bacterium]